MTTAALKKKIKALVDKETNAKKLKMAYQTLVASDNVAMDPEQAYERIKRAEADFDAGRYMSGEEAKTKIKAALKKRRTTKRNAA